MVSRTRKVIWTDKSRVQRKEIFSYWNRRNKFYIYSKKLRILFQLKMRAVAINPFIGRKSAQDDIRIVVGRSNLLVYQILDESILVLAVWEGHQNPQNFHF